MTISADAHRAAARQFASGVTVAAAGDADEAHAITATAFCSLSLEPPMVLLAVRSSSRLLRLIRRTEAFSVSVLAAHQRRVGEWAATTGRRPAPAAHHLARRAPGTGSPLVADALAWFDCRLHSLSMHGDHVVLVGLVEASQSREDLSPLLYFRGTYHELGAPSRLLLDELDVSVDEDESDL